MYFNMNWLILIVAGLFEVVWRGIGAIGGVVVGIIAFGESASALRIASAALAFVRVRSAHRASLNVKPLQ